MCNLFPLAALVESHGNKLGGKMKTFPKLILLDRDGTVARRYGVEGIPQLFIVDQDGRLLYRRRGYGGGLERDLKHILDGLLNGKTASRAG